MPLQIRRGTDVQRQAMTPAAGELIFVTNTNQLYVGNGSTPGGILATGYTNNDAQDAAAVIFTANNSAHSNINFAYNTSTNLITAVVNLSDYAGVIKADAFKGSVFADDGSTVGGTELVNAVDGSINLNGTVKGHIIPDFNVAYDLGSTSLRFRDLYLSGSSIELGAATITATGSAVNLPAGSTVNGEIIGTGSSNNDYSGNIIGDDSSIIVNTSTNTVSGTFIGDMTGSVFADDSTKIVDAVNNIVSADEINANNTLSNGVLSLTGQQLSSNQSDIQFASASGIFKYVCTGAQPDPALDLGDSIIAAIDSFTGLDLDAVPPDLSSSFVAGDITSTIKFIPLDPTRVYGAAVIGAQIDKTAFTEAYAPSKFFLMVEPDTPTAIAVGQPVEDVIRYVTYDSYGRFGVGREQALATVDINGFMKLKVLPAEPTVVEDSSIPNGFVAIADGVNWDPLSNGKQSMVVRLGDVWVPMAVAP